MEQQLFAEALSDDADLDARDDCVTLMLRLLGLMCDNQHRELQDYMREQSDNFLSCDLVSETTNFLGFVYSNINPRNVQLVDELMQALLEFVSVRRKRSSLTRPSTPVVTSLQLLLVSRETPRTKLWFSTTNSATTSTSSCKPTPSRDAPCLK